MVSELKGLVYAIICIIMYSLFSLFFKAVANAEFHSLLFITISMIFASIALLIKGGKNSLMLESLTSISTWVYGITFVLIFIFSIELLKYISATEMILVSRINILISFLFALIFLKRNNLKKGIWGVPLVILGLFLVFYQVQESRLYILLLGCLSALSKSAYFFSIELNKTSYKTKNYLDDFGVVGFILGVTSLICIIIMVSGSFASELFNINHPIFPKYSDYSNPYLFACAAGYGLFGFTALRYLEFKSVQSIKSEIFLCMITLVPLFTLCFEGLAGSFGILNTNIQVTPSMLLANLLIISGGLLIVILKFMSTDVTDEIDKMHILKMVRSTEIFANQDLDKAAKTLGLSKNSYLELLNNKNFTISKLEYKKIQNNFNKNIAMADHLTGLCNRLEFTTMVNHINKDEPANLFFIDLNKFKPVNDTYGHEAGDNILKQVGLRLAESFKDSVVTRMGGDEFCLLMRNTDKKDAYDLIKKIIKELERPFNYNSNKILISGSVGLANYPEDVSKPEELIAYADENMYSIKNSYER